MIKKLLVPCKENEYYPHLIRKSALFIYTLFLFLFNVISPLFFEEKNIVVASTISISNIVSLANKERVNAGLNSLNIDVRLNAAALAKANDMISKDYWDHFGPNGETPWQFISNAGYSYVYAGENLAKGFVTAEGVHQAWMSSPTHKANIMNDNYRDIGVAVVEGNLLGEDIILVVQMFGSTTVTKPVSDNTISSQEDTLNNEVISVESGEIKSISIVKPSEGDVLTDPAVDIEGKVDGYVSNIGEYHVVINRSGQDIAEAVSESSNWKVDKGSDWEEGLHEIEVYIKDQKDDFSDSVSFTIDSTPPTFYADTVTLKLDGNHAEVSVYIEERDATAMLNLGSENYGLAHVGNGIFTAYVPRLSVESSDISAKILVSDKSGNSTSMDISERLKALANQDGYLQTVSNESFLTKVFSGLSSISIRAKVNLGFSIVLLTILIVQVILYKKSGILHEKGGYLLTIGIFLFLVLVGTLTEVTGSIN